MTDKEKLIKIKSLADKMSDTAFNITTDASLLKKAIDEYHQFIIYEYYKEEPVSEDFEQAAVEAFKEIVDDERNSFLEIFKAGAMWQIAKLMANAIDGEVDYWNLRGLSVNVELPRSVNEGDKVKVILIKED